MTKAQFPLLTLLSAIGLIALGAGCLPGSTPVAANSPEAPRPPEPEQIVVPVEAETPQRGPIAAYLTTPTRVEAERRVELVSEGTGRCQAALAEEGDYVQQGQILAELDKEDVEAQVRQTEVQVAQSKVDYERSKKMLDEGLVSQAEYDAARFAYESALANLKIQRLQLQNMTIRAPIGGVVTARLIQVGQLVTSGTPVYRIVDPDSYVLYINPPEKELPRLHLGQQATVTVDSLGGSEFHAEVDRINPNVDPASGTIKVRLALDRQARDELLEGAFVRVQLVMETHDNALLVPKDAVVEENSRQYVFVVREKEIEAEESDTVALSKSVAEAQPAPMPPHDADPVEELARERLAEGAPLPSTPAGAGPQLIAERVEVEVGLTDGDRAEILSGITDDTLVITLGQKNLRDGTAVRLTSLAEEMAASADMTAEEALAAAEKEHEQIKKEMERQKQEARQRRLEEMARQRNQQAADSQ